MRRPDGLAEAYVYNTYGLVTSWGYRDFDFNRDGDVDNTDKTYFQNFAASGGGNPTTDPTADWDMDGDADTTDFNQLQSTMTGSGTPPVTLYTSAVGNEYFFTGRNLHFVELNPESPGSPQANHQLQYNRARHYDPQWGRWLQRDPAGYIDGMNLYAYVRCRPAILGDPQGLGSTDESLGNMAEDKIEEYRALLEAQPHYQNRAYDALLHLEAEHSQYEYYRLSRLNTALRRMIEEVPMLWYVPVKRGRAYARYIEGGTMELPTRPQPSSLFHEFIHRFQDIDRGLASRTQDEGEAEGAREEVLRLGMHMRPL